MPLDPQRVQSLFLDAVEVGAPAARAALLEQRCSTDVELRQRVEALLRAHDETDSFLDEPDSTLLASVDDPTREWPGMVIGSYKLLQQIGEGGMGTVFMAEQMQPVHRNVAIKILKPGMDSRQVIARFEAERQALALMDHPHIAKVLDAGTTDASRPYFVMELVKGVPITKYCDERRLTPRERLELFVPVCQAVQHAHQKGIIHRDLKPSNILVALYDGRPVPKVIDFGVAKATGSKLTERTLCTEFGAVIGTFEYMSPEQAELDQLDIDTRSDIYSMGVLLYELLSGTTPLEHKRLRESSFLEVLRIIREEESVTPSKRLISTEDLAWIAANRGLEPRKLSGLLRGELDWIVMKCLEKERNRRYETANGLARDIEHYLHDEPVQACPPSAWYRFGKFARRNKTALATVGLLAATLVLVIGVLAGSIGWIAKDRADRLAVTEERVTAALKDATELQEQKKWPEALEAVKRAEGLLATGSSEELRERVRERAKDLRMVLDLEEIRLPCAVRGVEGGFDQSRADASYAEKFRDYGIDVEALEPTEAAARIRARSIWPELTVALDNWAAERRELPLVKEASWKRLVAAARAADPDEWRNRIREAIEYRRTEDLKELAHSDKIKDLPLETLILIVTAGGRRGLYKEAELMAVLRLAQRRFPGDYWVNFKLAYAYDFSPPPYQQFDEAIRFYTAALSARPRNVPTLIYLGLALIQRSKFDEALARFRRALELKPDDADLCNTVAWFLATCPEPTFRSAHEAVRLSYKAVQQAPKKAEYCNTLGVAHFRAKNWHEVIADLDKAEKLAPGKYFAWNAFFLAMAHWQLGDKELARKEYDQAVEWMEKTRPDDKELRSFRAEAEELLQIRRSDAGNAKKVSSP